MHRSCATLTLLTLLLPAQRGGCNPPLSYCDLNQVSLALQIFINCYPPPLQAGLLRAYQDQSVELEGEEMSKVQAAVQRCG